MANRTKEEMVRLGLLGLTPFVAGAVIMWISPYVLPYDIAVHFHHFTLLYGAIIVTYLSGIEAGSQLAPGVKNPAPFLPGQLIALMALLAALPNGVFFLSLGAAWRHGIILILLVYLLMRDLALVSTGSMPKWYGNLRVRLTFWAGLAILLIISRLVLWGYY